MINNKVSYKEQKKCGDLNNYMDSFRYWYSRTFILFNLRESMINREITFMNKEGLVIKPLRVASIQGISYYFDKYKFFENKFDIYASVAILKDIPESSVSNEEMRENRAELKENWFDYVVGYDWVWDIDCKDFDKSKKVASKVINLFSEYKVSNLMVKFSGNKGWHITIPDSEIEKVLGKNIPKRIKILKNATKNITKHLKIKFGKGFPIDDIIEKRRIFSVPYSLHSKTGLVRLPVDDNIFKTFRKEDYSVSNVLNKVRPLVMRGLLPRKGEPEGLKRLLEEFNV